jgi:soluble lytic murein transglycosylase-like protein
MLTRRRAFTLVLFSLAAAPCSADLYSYIDEQGRGHFSDVALDARYELYMKDKPRVDTPIAPQIAASVPELAETAAQAAGPLQGRKHYVDMIARVAREQKVEAALIHAVVSAESSYNPSAKSARGATGLMQLMPDTARRYGVTDLLNPLENLRAGAAYLKDLLSLFDNNLRLAVAAYNAGEGAVKRSGNRIPAYAETRAYVPRVMQLYQQYRVR